RASTWARSSGECPERGPFAFGLRDESGRTADRLDGREALGFGSPVGFRRFAMHNLVLARKRAIGGDSSTNVVNRAFHRVAHCMPPGDRLSRPVGLVFPKLKLNCMKKRLRWHKMGHFEKFLLGRLLLPAILIALAQWVFVPSQARASCGDYVL